MGSELADRCVMLAGLCARMRHVLSHTHACGCSGSLAALVELMVTYYSWLFDDGVHGRSQKQTVTLLRYRPPLSLAQTRIPTS